MNVQQKLISILKEIPVVFKDRALANAALVLSGIGSGEIPAPPKNADPVDNLFGLLTTAGVVVHVADSQEEADKLIAEAKAAGMGGSFVGLDSPAEKDAMAMAKEAISKAKS